MGVFRIFMGTLSFINLLLMLFDWDAWFSEKGFLPSWIGAMFLPPTIHVVNVPFWPHGVPISRLNVLSGISDPRVELAFYLFLIVCSIFTTIGLWTRASSLLLAIGMVSLHHRDAALLHGGDTVLRVCILYMAIGPFGRACSVDRLIRLWKGKEPSGPVLVSLWPQRLICYNVALIYFTTVWLKSFGGLWKNGTATWYPARLNEFHRFPVPDFMNNIPMVYVTTYGTLVTELSLATLVFFKPFRKYALLGGIMMHAFIEYSMNIPLFSYLMAAMYICFYEGEEVSGWFERLGRRFTKWHATIRLPHDTRLKPQSLAILDAVDPFKVVTYLPGDTSEWGTESGGDPMRVSWTHSLGAWTFGWIPGLWRKLLTNSIEPIAVTEPAPVKERVKQ